jgi:hypothetical protein
MAKVRRREILISLAIVPMTGLSQQHSSYEIIKVTQQDLARASSCAALEEQISYIEAEIKRSRTDHKTVGTELRLRFEKHAAQLAKSIDDLQQAQSQAEIDKAFAAGGLALSLVFLGLGVALASPIAIGTLTAATVLTGAGAFAAQAILKQGEGTPTLIAGYTLDRTLMFGEMLTEHLSTASWRIAGGVLKSVALYLPASEIYEKSKDIGQAQVQLKLIAEELQIIQKTAVSYGTNSARWANNYENSLQGLQRGLREYIDRTRNINCLLPQPKNFPVITTPLK